MVTGQFKTVPSGDCILKEDETGDKSKFRLRITNIILICLYRDPVLTNIVNNDDSDVQNYSLEELSSVFFSNINQYAMQPFFGYTDDNAQEENFLDLCHCDHLR